MPKTVGLFHARKRLLEANRGTHNKDNYRISRFLTHVPMEYVTANFAAPALPYNTFHFTAISPSPRGYLDCIMDICLVEWWGENTSCVQVHKVLIRTLISCVTAKIMFIVASSRQQKNQNVLAPAWKTQFSVTRNSFQLFWLKQTNKQKTPFCGFPSKT